MFYLSATKSNLYGSKENLYTGFDHKSTGTRIIN